MATVMVTDTNMSKDQSRRTRSRTRSEARKTDQRSSPPTSHKGDTTGTKSPHDSNPKMLVDKEREIKINPYALKVKASKGVLTRRINDAKRSITAILSKEPELPTKSDLTDMRQHLSDVRCARKAIITAYTNIMCVDVPIMMETYEKNLDEQLDRAITFERDLKNGITRYEMEISKRAKSDSAGSSQAGYKTLLPV